MQKDREGRDFVSNDIPLPVVTTIKVGSMLQLFSDPLSKSFMMQ
jgi:hypothetical protein